MSVRSLVFEYKESGSRKVMKRDRRVRSSIQKTGRTARKNQGVVERWLQRSRKAINQIALVTTAAVGAILAASPTLRAQLGGVRAAFTLFADEIVRSVLPAGTNFGSMAIELVQRFRDLPGPIRKAASIITLVGGSLLALLPIIATVIKSASVVAGAFGTVLSVLAPVIGVAKAVGAGLLAIVGGASALTIGLAALAVAVVALAAAFILNVGNMRTRTIQYLTDLYTGARARLLALLQSGRDLSRRFRDSVVGFMLNVKDRVLALLSLGREMSQRGKEWVGGMVRGVWDRVSNLVSAFRSMASQAAQAFRDTFNRIIPDTVRIPRVRINIPNILGGGSIGVGGGSINIPQLNTGGRIARDGLAMLHAGERVVPAAQVRERGPQPTGGDTYNFDGLTINVSPMGDDARMTGRNIAQEFQRELEDRGI